MAFAFKKASQTEGPPPGGPDPGMLDGLLRRMFGIGIAEFQSATLLAQALVDELRARLVAIEDRLERIERRLELDPPPVTRRGVFIIDAERR